MLTEPYRPWGHLPWVFKKLKSRKWSLLGCLSTEERCLGTLLCCNDAKLVRNVFYIEVVDPEISEHVSSAQTKRNKHRRKLLQLFSKIKIVDMGLHDPAVGIKHQVHDFLESSGEDIILDISSFPKRYFFPILKFLYKSTQVKNLLVCYTIPEKYYSGRLAENPKDWDYLPTFQSVDNSDKEVEHAIVGVGFLPFMLPTLLKQDYEHAQVHLVFPFPPGPPHYQRTWDFVRQIEATCTLKDSRQIIRVDMHDMPGCYNHICNITNNGSEQAIFAPYGPKPHSLAMCLFAISHDSAVYYTQPTYYHPDYSSGVQYLDGSPETYTYCIKLNGVGYY